MNIDTSDELAVAKTILEARWWVHSCCCLARSPHPPCFPLRHVRLPNDPVEVGLRNTASSSERSLDIPRTSQEFSTTANTHLMKGFAILDVSSRDLEHKCFTSRSSDDLVDLCRQLMMGEALEKRLGPTGLFIHPHLCILHVLAVP